MTNVDSGRDVVERALELAKQADEVRNQAIQELLRRKQQIDRDLQTLGFQNGHHTNGNAAHVEDAPSSPVSKRFRGVTLADAARALLREHGTLHGSKIEELVKAGGFKTKIGNFQGYLPVALKRAGDFINLGKNTWKLKDGATV